jgi:hypothetical protein
MALDDPVPVVPLVADEPALDPVADEEVDPVLAFARMNRSLPLAPALEPLPLPVDPAPPELDPPAPELAPDALLPDADPPPPDVDPAVPTGPPPI